MVAGNARSLPATKPALYILLQLTAVAAVLWLWSQRGAGCSGNDRLRMPLLQPSPQSALAPRFPAKGGHSVAGAAVSVHPMGCLLPKSQLPPFLRRFSAA
jgi:hypothetical protein